MPRPRPPQALEAFAATPEGKDILADPQKLAKLLKYHAVKGERLEPAFKGDGHMKLATLVPGQSLTVTKDIETEADGTKKGTVQVTADSDGAEPVTVRRHNIIAGASMIDGEGAGRWGASVEPGGRLLARASTEERVSCTARTLTPPRPPPQSSTACWSPRCDEKGFACLRPALHGPWKPRRVESRRRCRRPDDVCHLKSGQQRSTDGQTAD
jgi:hypothetical protein